MMTFAVLFFALVGCAWCQNVYPVDIPTGGRMAVHGWLILPFDNQDTSDISKPIRGWFFHHVSEFPADSPHNFQIMVLGEIWSLPHAGKIVTPLAFPIPPETPEDLHEWTFTPPPEFSLNDLLSGNLTELQGVVYDGSFDTYYERIPTNIAHLRILDLTTAVWLNSSDQVPVYKNIHYLGYPVSDPQSNRAITSPVMNFYFAHELNAPVTDYDQILQVTINTDYCQCTCVESSCSCPDSSSSPNTWFGVISQPGMRWVAPGYPNNIGLPVSPNLVKVVAQTKDNLEITCSSLLVQRQLHCMQGPMFNDHCDFATAD
jgi:hypothetical protein